MKKTLSFIVLSFIICAFCISFVACGVTADDKNGIQTYSITYQNAETDNPTQYTTNNKEIVLTSPTKQGYKFRGWFDPNDKQVTVIPENSKGDLLLSARWDLQYVVKEIDAGYKILGLLDDFDTTKDFDLVIPEEYDGKAITEIGAFAFGRLSHLKSIVIPDSVKIIGDRAFKNCNALSSVVIGQNVTSIGNYAFQGCSGLTSIIIPNSVTIIGVAAFHSCSSLTSLVLPVSITLIDSFAFDNCPNLPYIDYQGTVEQWNSIDIIISDLDYERHFVTVHCTDGILTPSDIKHKTGRPLDY